MVIQPPCGRAQECLISVSELRDELEADPAQAEHASSQLVSRCVSFKIQPLNAPISHHPRRRGALIALRALALAHHPLIL